MKNPLRLPLWRLALLVLLAPAFSLSAAQPVGDLTGHWQLFVDDYLVASRESVARRYHAFKKHPANPIIVVDQPWEHNVIATSAVLPEENGTGYRMWYTCWAHKEDPDRHHALYATSADGLSWTKPALGLLPWKATGSLSNNLLPVSGSILHTPDDPDPNRRYKAISPGEFKFSSSPDGLHWRPLSQNAIFQAGDTGHVMWDPLTSKYRGYAKVNATVAGLRRRAIGYSESTGFESWPPLKLIMAPDDVDDRWVKPGSIQRTHFYNCPVFAYENIYVGLVSIYRAEDDEGYFHGPLYTELVTSRDGFHWTREEGDRPPLLACGPDRTWDHGMVLSLALVPHGEELWLYYTGYDGLHDYLPFHSAIGLATMRKDGFVSLDGDDNPGIVTTKPLRGLTGRLHLNCDAAAGLLQVEVLGQNGVVVRGYGKNDFNEPRGAGTDQLVTWREHTELPATSEPLRLRFHLKNVSLYSFSVEHAIQVESQPEPSLVNALFTFEGDSGKRARNQLAEASAQDLKFLGTSKIDREPTNAAFGKASVAVASPWRPLNTLQVTGSARLGSRFTLATMARSTDHRLARLFSSYNGNRPVNTSELVFDCDPSGKVIPGLRLICRGIPVTSAPVTFADGKYHHLGVTYDDGRVRFYLDGEPAGEEWLPGGSPVSMPRDLLVGEDAELGSDEQFNGNLDDVLVLGRVLSPDEIKRLAHEGGEAFFGTPKPRSGKKRP